MFSSGTHAPPTPRAVLGFVVGIAVLYFWGAAALGALLGEAGLLAAEWLLLFLPAMLWVRASGHDPVRTLSLRRPGSAGLTGGLLLGAGALPLVWGLTWVQSEVVPMPPELLEGMEALVTADSPLRYVWLLIVLAVTPAVCEEVVFRGVLLSGTRSLPPVRAILLNGLVFGAFHLTLATAARFLPTAALGCAIAWAVWRTGSIWVGVAMHFVNNAAIVTIASWPAVRGALSDPTAPPPMPVVVLGGLTFAAGIGILQRMPPASGPETTPTTPDP